MRTEGALGGADPSGVEEGVGVEVVEGEGGSESG
jgi:hypothetical protein